MEPMEKTYQTIASNIRLQRKQQRLSQARLAEIADVSLDTVKNVEAGRRSMRLDTYLRLVEALGLTPTELLGTGLSGTYAERLVFMTGGRSENELRFALHVVEQALKAEDLYIKE